MHGGNTHVRGGGLNGYCTEAGYVDEADLRLMARTLLDYLRARKVTYVVAELVLDEAKKMLDACTLGNIPQENEGGEENDERILCSENI